MKKSYDTSNLGSFTILAIMESYADAFLQAEYDAANAAVTMASSPQGDEASELSPLLQLIQHPDNPEATLGVVSIKGQLTDRDSPYNHYYGLVSYNQIRAAIVDALDNQAMGILFDTNTPGGALSGMRGLSDFIEALPVPTVFHTSSTLCSAGLFLALSGDHVLASDMAEVGSIGVVVTLVEYSKAMAEVGFTPTIIRSGSLKQVGNPAEPLSAEAKAHITDQVMTYANKFYNFVGTKRKMQLSETHKSGRTFIGEEAASPEINLVDRITTFEEALSFSLYLANNYLDKQRQMSNANNNNFFKGDTTMTKKLSGAALAAVVQPPEQTEESASDTQAPVADAQVVEPTAEMLVLKDRVTELEAANAELEAKVLTLTEAQTASTNILADAEALKEIVTAQISTMRVALALVPVDFSALSISNVVQEYSAVAASFAKSFPIGGVVPESKDTTNPVQAAKLSAEESRAIKALSF